LPGKASPQAEGTDGPDLVTAGAAMAGNTAVNILGYDDQRREIAKQLKVDPYTTNKVLADKLDEVAWAAFAGGLGITALKMAAPASTLVSMSAQASAWVWDTPPGDLKVYIEETLSGMGVSQEHVDLFLRQRWYTLTLRTRFAKALERIDGAEGQADLMELALTVESEDQARFVIEALEMLATYHEKTAPIQAIEVRGTVIGRTKAGAIVLPAPVDYAAWTERLDRFTSRDDLAAEQRTLLLRGSLTPMAREKLDRLGWQLPDGVSG